jgi:virginiamycin B lyase
MKRYYSPIPAMCATLAGFIVVTVDSSPVSAQTPQPLVEEWTVPWAASRPRDPYVAPDGRVWFVGQRSDYAAVFDPESEEFQRFDLPDGAGPHNLIVGDDGRVWYAGNRQAHIGILDPVTGEVEQIPMPDDRARDPHTLVFDDSGHIWFTVQTGNFVGRLDMETRTIDLIEVPTPHARPYGIKVAPDGRPWFVEFAGGKVGTIDPETLQLEEFDLPDSAGRPRRIAIDSQGDIWYVDYSLGELGRMTRNGEFEVWPVPSGIEGRPYALGIDDADHLYFVETGPSPNQLVIFDSGQERVQSVTSIPSGGGAVRHMMFDSDRQVFWFGTDANTLARVRVPVAPPTS